MLPKFRKAKQTSREKEERAILGALEELVARRRALSTIPRHSGRALGDLLLARGFIVAAELDYALARQHATGARLGAIVVELGLVPEQDVIELLAEQFRIDVLDLTKRRFEPRTARRLAEADARRLDALPLHTSAKGIAVAVVDPTRPGLVDELTQLLHCPVHLFLTSQATIDRLIDLAYGT